MKARKIADWPAMVSTLFAAALAGAAGSFTVAASAHADPDFSNCTEFGFNGHTVIDGYPQSQPDPPWHVSFDSTGTTASGPAVVAFNGGDTVTGHVSGGIMRGRNIHLEIQWEDKPNNFWEFTGTINDRARANGNESLASGAMPAHWTSATSFDCLATKPQGAPRQTDPASLPYGPGTCAQGFVWRASTPTDKVCVSRDVYNRTVQENAAAALTREPDGGAYGPDTCAQGFVWRAATPTDHVCVLPTVRDAVAADNAAAPSHLAANQSPP